jgi:peptidyl-prolyl cis-trans isomerase B (cyclophilin B)
MFCIMISTSLAENPQYRISVTRGGVLLGDITIEMFPDVAPKHVHNFDSLVSIGFYNGTAFHRVIPGFMIQGGDPNSRSGPRETWGYGDPSQTTVPAEFSTLKHVRGILSAARANDPNSATSQFFICVATAQHLDGKYSIYGKVLTGMDVVDTIVRSPRDGSDNPFEKVEMSIVKLLPTNVDEYAQTHAVTVTPNPASGEVFLHYTSRVGTEIRYTLYNSLGEQVMETRTRPRSTGEDILSADVSTLPSGVYYWRIQSGTTTTTSRFVVLR